MGTEKIAKALANGLEKAGFQTGSVNPVDVQIPSLSKYNIVAVGALTQAPTAPGAMKDFLAKTSGNTDSKE